METFFIAIMICILLGGAVVSKRLCGSPKKLYDLCDGGEYRVVGAHVQHAVVLFYIAERGKLRAYEMERNRNALDLVEEMSRIGTYRFHIGPVDEGTGIPIVRVTKIEERGYS